MMREAVHNSPCTSLLNHQAPASLPPQRQIAAFYEKFYADKGITIVKDSVTGFEGSGKVRLLLHTRMLGWEVKIARISCGNH